MILNQNEKNPDAIAEEIPEVVHVPVIKNSWLNPNDGIGKLETGFVLDDVVYSAKQTQPKTTRFTIRNRK
ncbi:MAG: hypothetical protein RLZ77_526 [Bacteroidota bacterium]|jgi:hypothetical protein